MSITRKVFTTLNLAIFTILSLFNFLAVPSSSLVTFSRPPTISLKITDSSFRYASPRFWNQLSDSFRQLHHCCLDSPPHPLVNPSFSSSPLSSSITPSLFHSRLKTYLFNKSFQPKTSFTYWTAFMIMGLDRTYHTHQFIFSFTLYFFLFIPCGRLSCYPSAFCCTLNTHCRIVSYRIEHRFLTSLVNLEIRIVCSVLIAAIRG